MVIQDRIIFAHSIYQVFSTVILITSNLMSSSLFYLLLKTPALNSQNADDKHKVTLMVLINDL